jgi:gluconolactonase
MTIDDDGTVREVEWKKLRPPPNLTMPAGVLSTQKGTIFCAQGSMGSDPPSGVYIMPRGYPPRPMVTSYYGRPFNGVYACTLDQDENVWFVDSRFGFDDDFRPSPQMPCYIFRLEDDTSEVQVMGSGLWRPSGLAFSPDFQTLYVSDAGHSSKSPVDPNGPTT